MRTDNSDLFSKLELRRYFLRKYHADGPLHVLDCCQGDGVIWRRLRGEFSVDSYWGMDLKSKKGRLKLDSTRILAQPGCRLAQNVIDVDTYGSPWKHWEAILQNLAHSMTVFLTRGHCDSNRVRLSTYELNAMGLTLARIHKMSGAITHNLEKIVASYVLARACGLVVITEAIKVTSRHVSYFGVRLEPMKTNYGNH